MADLYRVGKLQQGKWSIEIDRAYPLGNNWHIIAKASSKRLLESITKILNRLDRDF